ncbi:MAG: peroxide stress protein YaaA [Bacteroidota bacterium]
MLVLLSPAKTLDLSATENEVHSLPRLLTDSQQLVETLREKSKDDLKTLMKVSDKIAALNHNRFRTFKAPFNRENSKQALLAFKGDVYTSLQVEDFDTEDLSFAQKHLRILSGLYGLLRPLDLMQPYRLEMGTRLAYNESRNLYEFWGDKITTLINEDIALTEGESVVNLASEEYFKAVQKTRLSGKLYKVDFKENRAGHYKTIAFNAKKARGAMAREIIKQRIEQAEDIKNLVINSYQYNPIMSEAQHLVFTKEQ